MRIRWSKCPSPARAMSEVEYDRLLDVVKTALARRAELPKAVNDNLPACLSFPEGWYGVVLATRQPKNIEVPRDVI